MSKTQKSLVDQDGRIDYSAIIEQFPWVIAENQKAILSPDSDGILCGLLMSHLFDWSIVGFYDGKVLLLRRGISAKDCIFLDMDIFRSEIKSIGHHMVSYRFDKPHPNFKHYVNCIQPNNIRKYDFSNSFNLKYPLATIHLLLGILGVGFAEKIEIRKDALCLLLYTDGTFKNLFNYPENCLSWLEFLRADEAKSLLHPIFYNDHYTISDLMIALKDFFNQTSLINSGKRGGDKISLSDAKGKIKDFVKRGELYSISSERKVVAEKFINLLSNLTGWRYRNNLWNWEEFELSKFSKAATVPTLGRYNKLLGKKPLSMAITSRNALEYTLEKPDKLP